MRHGRDAGKREPELIFNVYGKTYFLAQIWTGGSQGHELIMIERRFFGSCALRSCSPDALTRMDTHKILPHVAR